MQSLSNLNIKLKAAQDKVNAIQKEIQKETEKMQSQCKHENTIREDDGDYHKPRYYITCKDCSLCLRECEWK